MNLKSFALIVFVLVVLGFTAVPASAQAVSGAKVPGVTVHTSPVVAGVAFRGTIQLYAGLEQIEEPVIRLYKMGWTRNKTDGTYRWGRTGKPVKEIVACPSQPDNGLPPIGIAGAGLAASQS